MENYLHNLRSNVSLTPQIHLFLSVLDGEFQPVKSHPLPVLVGGPGRVVVEEDLQLPRAPGVVQERRRKIHNLFSECLGLQRELRNYFADQVL